jgi:hypothetical protein
VIGYVNERRLELHQRVEGIEYSLHTPFQRRNYLERDEGFAFGPLEMFCDSHGAKIG